jgi:hypothetical protein
VQQLDAFPAKDKGKDGLFPNEPARRALIWEDAPVYTSGWEFPDQPAPTLLSKNDEFVLCVLRSQSADEVNDISACPHWIGGQGGSVDADTHAEGLY